MKTYELVQRQRLYINMEKLANGMIDYLATKYEPEDYHLIDGDDVTAAIEDAVDYQENVTLRSEYDNWNEILSEIAYDVAEYIKTHNVQHELVPIILHYIV